MVCVIIAVTDVRRVPENSIWFARNMDVFLCGKQPQINLQEPPDEERIDVYFIEEPQKYKWWINEQICVIPVR